MKMKLMECDNCGEMKLCGRYHCYDSFQGFADSNPIDLGESFICNECIDDQKKVGPVVEVNE